MNLPHCFFLLSAYFVFLGFLHFIIVKVATLMVLAFTVHIIAPTYFYYNGSFPHEPQLLVPFSVLPPLVEEENLYTCRHSTVVVDRSS